MSDLTALSLDQLSLVSGGASGLPDNFFDSAIRAGVRDPSDQWYLMAARSSKQSALDQIAGDSSEGRINAAVAAGAFARSSGKSSSRTMMQHFGAAPIDR